MFRRIFSAATLAFAVMLASASHAQAAPLFLTPDVNYASHGDALFFKNAGNWSMTLNTALGDQMSIDRGSGFTSLPNATLNVNVAGGELGAMAMTIGSGELLTFVNGTLLSETVHNNIVGGKDIFAVFRITESTVSGFNVGGLAGLDVFAYNGHGIGNDITAYKVKGDVAPVVPEPATLGFLIFGLGGLAASARRKLLA